MDPDGLSSAENLAVSLVQMNSRDLKRDNIDIALLLIDGAATAGARLVALPEVWPYLGPQEGNLTAAEPIPGPLTDLLAERAARHGIYIHAGTMHETRAGEPKIFNTTVVISPAGEIIAKYSKIHMFDVVLDGVATYQESATVTPGDDIVTVDVDGVRVGLAICYDLRFPELFRILALRGAEVIVLPAAFTMMTGKDHWEVLIRARAIENQVYMLAPAQYGADASGKWCYGRSMIVDPWGTVRAVAPDRATTVGLDLDLSYLRGVRRQIPSLANRMPQTYSWPEPVAVIR